MPTRLMALAHWCFVPRQMLCAFLILWSFVAAVSSRADDGVSEITLLRGQYLSLRNTDVSISKADEWIALAQRFEELSKKRAGDDAAAVALYYAALLYDLLNKKNHNDAQIKKSVELLSEIERRYPTHTMADEAYLKHGEILANELHDLSAAKAVFQSLIARYPESDSALLAHARLNALGSKSTRGGRAPPHDAYVGSANPPTPLLIVIDPGHGGEDLGAVGQGGLLEKDVTLDVARILQESLRQELGAKVILTRSDDTFVPLAARTTIANDAHADLFISLHTNASPAKKLSGFEVFYLDNTNDAASKKLAERENMSVQFEGPQGDLQFMLSDLIQNGKLDDSIALANLIHREIVQELRPHWQSIGDYGVRKAPFYVLVGAHMPCILVEMFFIDNILDGKKLADKSFRRDLAHGLLNGIKNYLSRRHFS